jgi:hypothetical protein
MPVTTAGAQSRAMKGIYTDERKAELKRLAEEHASVMPDGSRVPNYSVAMKLMWQQPDIREEARTVFDSPAEEEEPEEQPTPAEQGRHGRRAENAGQ